MQYALARSGDGLMTENMQRFEELVAAGIADYVGDAFETNAQPCYGCVAGEFLEDKLSPLLADMYLLGKDGKHKEVLERLIMMQVMLATSATIYDKLIENWFQLFEQEYKQDMEQFKK